MDRLDYHYTNIFCTPIQPINPKEPWGIILVWGSSSSYNGPSRNNGQQVTKRLVRLERNLGARGARCITRCKEHTWAETDLRGERCKVHSRCKMLSGVHFVADFRLLKVCCKKCTASLLQVCQNPKPAWDHGFSLYWLCRTVISWF